MTDDGTVLLKVENIGKRFGSTEAVADLSLDLKKGEIFTLLGPSGCGKSTTLRMVAGLEHPDTGTISLRGKSIVDAGAGRFLAPEARNMGMVFQAYAVWPHMSVFDNIAFPLRVRRERRADMRTKVMESLELVGLAAQAESYPWQLSGGMQQRVALARALVYSPDLLLLDEPLSNLDAKLREQMRVELKAIQRRLGGTFLFVTHDQAEAMSLSTRIAVMNAGRVEQVGTPAEVYEQPATPFVRDFLGQSILLPGAVRRNGADSCVELDAGARLPVPDGASELPDGKRVTMACRCESVKLEPGDNEASDRIAGVIEDFTYVGDRMDYSVRAGDRVVTVRCYDDTRYDEGARVSLCFGRKGITVWPDGD